MLVTSSSYNAVICGIIMFGSVCWGGNISKLDRGRLEKIVKKQVMLWESQWLVLRLYTKRDYRRSRSGRTDFYFRVVVVELMLNVLRCHLTY